MEDIYYVYALTDNGCIFYIGCSKNVLKRYMDHITGNNAPETYDYIQNMMLQGKMPGIGICCGYSKNKARKAESKMILDLCELGHNLVNSNHNFTSNQIRPVKLKLDIKKKITQRMKDDIYFKQERAKFFSQKRIDKDTE